MNLKHSLILIIQDAAMQLCMDVGFRKQKNFGVEEIINYAAYKAEVVVNLERFHLCGMILMDTAPMGRVSSPL